jgi:hypothetical protein
VDLFGNPAVFPLREDPRLCDPASRRVCHFGSCLVGSYPIIASPTGDNPLHNNSGQQHRSSMILLRILTASPAVTSVTVRQPRRE